MKNKYVLLGLFAGLVLSSGNIKAQAFTPVHTGLIASFGTWTYTNTAQTVGDATQGDCISLFNVAAGNVVSPAMDFTTCGSTPYLTFKFRREGNSDVRARIGIEISTNGTAGPWTNIGNLTPVGAGWFIATPIDLSAYSANNNVAIRLIANNLPTAARYPIIDDIHIYCATPPANDNCAGAIALVPGGIGICNPIAGTVNYATQSAPASTCGGTPNNDVWYSFVASSANMTISVTGNATMDAIVELMSGACGALTSLQCRDLTLSGGTEQFTYSGLTVGNTYYIRVYDYYAAPPVDGSFTICVYQAAVAASNCGNATPIACGGSLVGQTNVGTVNDVNSWSCHVDGFSIPITTDGEDRFYSVTTTAAGYIRLTFTNVSGSGTYLELIGIGSPCTAGTCVRSTQMDISTGLFTSNGLNSWDYDVPGAGTYYFAVDAQGAGSTLNWDIEVNCYATGIRIDTLNNCGAAYGTGDPNQGIYTTWNAANAPATYDASLGGTFTVCEAIYLRNTGWEWLKTFEMTIGSCWINVRNLTPTGNNFAYYAVNNVNCNPTEGWSAAAVGNLATWTFLHPNRYINLPPWTCQNVSTWGDGNLIVPPYTCAKYTFCYTADIDPTCVLVNGLQNTVSGTDDGIGGGGGTMPSNVLITYPWAVNISTLPVQLLSYRGSCSGDETHIYWSTASETNNDYFSLERSFDGRNFELLQKISGAANSTDVHAYRFIDETVFDRVVYYSLSQTDFDGKTTVIGVINVNCGNAFDLNASILNHSIEGYMNIRFNSIEGESYAINLMDATGKQVYSTVVSASGETSEHQIPVTGLSAGIYTISIVYSGGVYTDKFFIE